MTDNTALLPSDEGGARERNTVEVPAEVFALLYAWCFVSSPKVPKQLKAHPNWPANGKNTKWALVDLLEPAYRAALAKAEPR